MKKSQFVQHFKVLVEELEAYKPRPENVIRGALEVLERTEPPGHTKENYTPDHPYVLALAKLYEYFFMRWERVENFHYRLPLLALEVMEVIESAWEHYEGRTRPRTGNCITA